MAPERKTLPQGGGPKGLRKPGGVSDEDGKRPEDLDTAIQQIVSKAVSSEQVVDIFSAAGLKKPDISILSLLHDYFTP